MQSARVLFLSLAVLCSMMLAAVPANAGCFCAGSQSIAVGVGMLGNNCSSATALLINDMYAGAENQCAEIGAVGICNVNTTIGSCTVSPTQVKVSGTIYFGCLRCFQAQPPPMQ